MCFSFPFFHCFSLFVSLFYKEKEGMDGEMREEAVVYCIEKKYIFNKKLKLRKNPTNKQKILPPVFFADPALTGVLFFLKAQLWQPLRRRQ